MVELIGLTKSFGRQIALQSIHLSIISGQTTVLIGPSGSGKSTLLRLLIGLIQPDAGEIRFEGTRVSPENIVALRRKMGYVIQEGGLFPHLTARKNVSLMAEYFHWPEKKITNRIQELIAITQFPEDGLDRFPVQLSGGQRQRVSLMRALMLDPDLLLLDEPLGALDPMIRADLQNDLKSIFSRLKKTVLLVTHDMGEAGFLGDTIVLMRDGTIVQSGTLEELVFSPDDPFVTQFINAQRSCLENLGRK